MKRPVKLRINGENYEARQAKSLLEGILALGLEVSHACGGMGSCGTCRVRILSEVTLPPRNDLEEERAQELGFSEETRLSCQLPCLDGLEIAVKLKSDN